MPAEFIDEIPKAVEAASAPVPVAAAPAELTTGQVQGRQAEEGHSQEQYSRVVGKLVGNHIECADPKLVIIEQQYLKYVKGYKDIVVDGKYGGETHGYLRASLGVKTPFEEVAKNPTNVCKFILFPDGLTKRAGVSTFNDLTKLIQSKMPKGEVVGVKPKVSVVQKKTTTTPSTPTNAPAASTNTIVRSDIIYGVRSNLDKLWQTIDRDDSFAKVQKVGNEWIMVGIQPGQTLKVPSTYWGDLEGIASGKGAIKESWSIRNKNKYTQNLFERLITSINNGENK